MSQISIEGLGVALATPFNEDFSVDYDALGRLIEYQIEGGVDYMVVLATTSEAVTLDCHERHAIARFVAQKVNGRIPLIMGVSSNCTHQLVNHLPEIDFTGYSAILSVVPYYNKPSQEGIYRHFAALAQASHLPIVLYNVPSRTGKNMDVVTTLRLANDFPGKIIGVKEASGDLDQIERIIRERPAGFQVVSGDDSMTLKLIGRGADGVISVVGNALPKMFGHMVHVARISPFDPEVAEINQILAPLDKALFAEGNPSGIKCLLSQMGLAKNILRLPLVPVSDATATDIAQAYDGCRQWLD